MFRVERCSATGRDWTVALSVSLVRLGTGWMFALSVAPRVFSGCFAMGCVWMFALIVVPRLCGTVYGYVPVEVIDAVIEKHGGINEEAAQIVLGEQWYEE